MAKQLVTKLTFLVITLFFISTIASAQDSIRTEEYSVLELTSKCNIRRLTLTNNASGTIVHDTYNARKSQLTDNERILIAMNDLNGKGFNLKSTTVTSNRCKSLSAFHFLKTRIKRP